MGLLSIKNLKERLKTNTVLALLGLTISLNSLQNKAHAEIRFFTNEPKFEDKLAPAKEHFLKILKYLDEIELSHTTPLHRELFGEGINGEVYTKILSQIQSVGYTESSNEHSVASTPFSKVPLMTIGDKFPLSDDAKNFVLAFSVVLHEAWHLNLGSHKPTVHALCSGAPFLQGDLNYLLDKRGCDDDVRGAYVAQIVMLHNISQYCTNCSAEIMRESALLSQKLRVRALTDQLNYILSEDLDFLSPMVMASREL